MKHFHAEIDKQIFNIIRIRGPISQTQIARVIGLSTASVNNAVKRLLKDNWIQKEGTILTHKRGRPQCSLKVVPNNGIAVGVDVGAQNLRVGLVDLSGEVLSVITEKTRPDGGPEDIIYRVKKIIWHLIESSNLKLNDISGIGLGLSGVIDPIGGLCLFSPNLPGWINIPIQKIFVEEFNTEVIVDDSVRMMALGEKRYGLGKDVDDFVYISLGIGIGCAIFINGRLYKGSEGIAGEFGHITVKENGPLCHCGNTGCLEALASGRAIVQQVRDAINLGVYSSVARNIDTIYEDIDVRSIMSAALEGDKLSFDVIDKTGTYIGIGISALLNLLNPRMVILGGGVIQLGEALLVPIRRTVKRRALGMISRNVLIQQGIMGEYVGVIGGAVSVFDKLFSESSSVIT